jgi:predicted phosphoribosyltransferase
MSGEGLPMTTSPRFRDRAEAGKALAALLAGDYGDRSGVIVLGLPRGGVPIAYEVARALGAPLDVFMVRKLGVPGQPELAMGAVASGGSRVLNRYVMRMSGVTDAELERVTESERDLLARREASYRGDRPPLDVADRVVIVVDDGLATGASMRAAVEALRGGRPAELVVAVPVAPPDSRDELAGVADKVVCARTPHPFFAVGHWYDDFSEVTDDEVRRFLADAAPA